MFKTDKKSLERLSFGFDERDIANFKAILAQLKSENLLTISQEEVQRALTGLDSIGKLKLNGKVYAFHVIDDYVSQQTNNCEGVELYLRQGDRLEDFYVPTTRDELFKVNDAINFLKNHKISSICTGQIPQDSDFLGLPYLSGEMDLIIRNSLENEEIKQFESNEIKVTVLDSLI